MNLDLVPRSCKYAVNKVVWRIRIPKLNLDLVPKSCKKHCKPGGLEDQDPKSKISKINFASWIEAFVDICLHFVPKSCKYAFLEDQDPKTESGFSPKIMQIRCKPGGLEDKDPKTESGFSSKIMQKHSKPGSLEDQDPKSKISKIMQICCRGLEAFDPRHLFHQKQFLKDQDPKSESRFSPKINFASWVRGFCRHSSHPGF